MSLQEPSDKTRMFRNLLKSRALIYFEHLLRRRLEAKNSELHDNELIGLVLRELYIVLVYIPKHTIHEQIYHMRRGLHMGLHMSVQKLVVRLNDLNRYLFYFPEENTKQLDQDEIIEILDQAKV
jgi:hypothetical protein